MPYKSKLNISYSVVKYHQKKKKRKNLCWALCFSKCFCKLSSIGVRRHPCQGQHNKIQDLKKKKKVFWNCVTQARNYMPSYTSNYDKAIQFQILARSQCSINLLGCSNLILCPSQQIITTFSNKCKSWHCSLVYGWKKYWSPQHHNYSQGYLPWFL